MRNLIRSPLAWLVAAECMVVAALIAVAWTVIAAGNRPSPPAAGDAPTVSSDSSSDVPQIPQVESSPVRGPLPGLALDPAFWRDRLGELNGDQAYLEQLEWLIVHDAQVAAERYVETVVVPTIQRAERGG